MLATASLRNGSVPVHETLLAYFVNILHYDRTARTKPEYTEEAYALGIFKEEHLYLTL